MTRAEAWLVGPVPSWPGTVLSTGLAFPPRHLLCSCPLLDSPWPSGWGPPVLSLGPD